MFLLKAAHCRVFQSAFRLALPVLPYRKPELLSSCSGLENIIQKERLSSLLIVTDKGIVQTGLVASVEKALQDAFVSYTIYDNTQPNPTVANVEEALALYKENNCNGLISIGGDSSMDCAKVLGARITYPGKTLNQLKVTLRVQRKLPVLIAIPTTADPGSEVTLAAIITDSEKHDKYALMSFPLIPHYAAPDAFLT